MGEPEAKKSKKESEEKGADAAEELDLADLSSFKLKRVLNENSERKEIFLEGREAIQQKQFWLECWLEKRLQISFCFCDMSKLPIFELFICVGNSQNSSGFSS